jgi:hypothetical protein
LQVESQRTGRSDVEVALARLDEATTAQQRSIESHIRTGRWALWGVFFISVALVLTVFFVLSAASTILDNLLTRLAELMKFPNAAQILGKPLVESAPRIVNDSTPMVVAASGLIIVAFLLIGIVRYHVRRAAVAEDRLYDLQRMRLLCGCSAAFPAVAIDALASDRHHRTGDFSDMSAHPVVDVIKQARAAVKSRAPAS